MTCPYRIAPEHGCTPSAVASDGVLSAMRKREHDGRCIGPQRQSDLARVMLIPRANWI